MKNLLIGLMVLGSISAFGQTCDENIESLILSSKALGGSESMLVVNNATADKFQVYKQLFQTYPDRNEIGGYTRETLEEEIQETNQAIARLEKNLKDSKNLIKLLKKEVKETCR
jgi:DNA gyrase/topoisomerase IV subunit A